jgi:hypothetical protein
VDWLKLKVDDVLNSDRADVTDAAAWTWIKLLAAATRAETGGRLVGVKQLSGRALILLANVTHANVAEAEGAGFVKWIGDDLAVLAYDAAGEAMVKSKRKKGKQYADKRWSAHRSPNGSPMQSPGGSPSARDGTGRDATGRDTNGTQTHGGFPTPQTPGGAAGAAPSAPEWDELTVQTASLFLAELARVSERRWTIPVGLLRRVSMRLNEGAESYRIVKRALHWREGVEPLALLTSEAVFADEDDDEEDEVGDLLAPLGIEVDE